MIKRLHIEDLEETKKCAQAFFDEAKMPGKFDFDHWVTSWAKMMEMGIGVIFAVQAYGEIRGMLGGIHCQCTMTGDEEAIEMFWYVMPKIRGNISGIALLRHFENWARDLGAVRIKMIHLADLNATVIKDIYTRMGYQPAEFAYWKPLIVSSDGKPLCVNGREVEDHSELVN